MSSESAPPELIVATIAGNNHLPRARVLAASLARVHPGLPFAILLMDEPDGRFDPAGEPFEVIAMDDIPEAGLRTRAFRYERRAACASAKPELIRHLFARGHQRVLLLDPDIVVVDDLEPLLSALDEASIALTPHLVTPATGPDARAHELTIGLAGVVNTGVMGIRADATGERFVEWWRSRLSTHCIANVAAGLHLDQRWVDLVPGLFDGVQLVRDPGVNVAYWNLAERPLRIDGGRITAAGHPCRLLHASGYDVRHPERLSIYAPSMTLEGMGDVRRLADRYRRALLDAGEAEALSWQWAFDRYADGAAIDEAARIAHLELGADADRFGDPFAVGSGSFREWLGST